MKLRGGLVKPRAISTPRDPHVLAIRAIYPSAPYVTGELRVDGGELAPVIDLHTRERIA